MNLRDLEYLLAVAESLHFGQAAEKCHVSQPTLSGQIKKLEDLLQVKIFERDNKHVFVTPIGQQVLEHAQEAIHQANIIRELAAAHRDPMAGPFRLGIIPTLGPYLVPLMLHPLRQQFPQTKLVLSEQMTHQLEEGLETHQLDAAILATPVDDSQFKSLDLFDEPFWLAHHRSDALYQADHIGSEELSKLKLLLLSDGHCLADQVFKSCGDAGLPADQLESDLRASSLETLLQLVAAGYGSTLVPALAMRGGWLTDMGIIARPVEVEGAYRTVRLVYRSSFPRPTAIRNLAQIILQQLPNTVHPIAAID